MNKSRLRVSILLTVVAFILIGALMIARVQYPEFFDNNLRHYTSALRIDLNDHPDFVTSPTVNLSGRVSHAASIDVSRDGVSLRKVFASDGDFSTEIELKPGENQIKFSARRFESDQPDDEKIATVIWQPKNPPAPTLNLLPSTTNLPVVIITGTTFSVARVEIIITPDVGEETKTHWPNAEGVSPIKENQTADNSGAFQLSLRLPVAGPYKVTAVAYNSYGDASRASSELKFLYDPDWYPPSSPVELPTASERVIRKANVVLAHKRMSITLQVIMPRDNSKVRALLANEISTTAFFEDLFGLKINKSLYGGEFDHVVSQIEIKDQNATVTATTAPDRTVRSYLPVLNGELTLGGDNNFPFSGPQDSLTVTAYDYEIKAVSPSPTLFQKNTLTWTGNDATGRDQDWTSLGEVKLQLAYQPFSSPRNLLRLTQISPYYLWNYPGSTIPRLLYGLCSLIPMLWALWLLQDSQIGHAIDLGLRGELSRLTTTLITLSLIATVLDISWGLAYLGWQLHILQNPSSSADPLLHCLADIAILLLALLCRLVASRRKWAIWVSRISRGFCIAALICLLLDVSNVLVHERESMALIVGVPIVVGSLSVFFSRIVKVLKYSGLLSEHRRVLLMSIMIASVTVVLPGISLDSKVSLRSLVSQSFSILDSFLPYALAIGLVIILKSIKSPDFRTRVLILCIGLILFSGYLVGPTSTLFMIPIPFIISIWIFRKFLIHDAQSCAEMDFVNSEVVVDRKGLIDKVLAYETAQHFQADIDKLKDKVSSGDMTLKEFEDRKVEIEKYAYDKELASTHVNGLRAEMTVLSIGPNTDDWINGRWCLKWGAALIAPFLLVYLLLLLVQSTYLSNSTFGFMLALNQVLTFLSDWLIAAFFFGYYFRYIRGASGLQKGLRTACAMIICLLPAWLTHVSSKTDLIGLFFRGGQTFLFFTLLGMAAFDYATFRNALRGQFRWRTFARFGDMPSFTAVVSVLITTLGVGLTTVLTGQFKDLLAKLINAAFQQTPGPPL